MFRAGPKGHGVPAPFCLAFSTCRPCFVPPAERLQTLRPYRCCLQALLLPMLLKWVRQERILVSAVASSALEMAGFAVAPFLGRWSVYAAIVVGAPGSMAFPVISALKSVHAGAQEQGKVQVLCPLPSAGCLFSTGCAGTLSVPCANCAPTLCAGRMLHSQPPLGRCMLGPVATVLHRYRFPVAWAQGPHWC